MSIILLLIYFIYFRHDIITLQNLPKILKGLNSNTFNHLELYSNYIKVEDSPYRAKPGIVPHQFYSECVRLSRPCVFNSVGDDWDATTKWSTFDNGYNYLKNKLDKVEVYVTPNNNDDRDLASEWNSFKEKDLMEMEYSEFVKKVIDTSGLGLAIKSEDFYDRL